jgi:type IV pilus assembly protein PilC
VVQSLNILSKQADKQGMKDRAQQGARGRRDRHAALGLAAKHPSIFNKLYIYLVRAGEVSGNLDGILERVAAYFEKQAGAARQDPLGDDVPGGRLVIALAVTYFLLTGIVPQFAQILDQLGGDLPIITRVLVGISDYLQNFWWLNLIIIVASVVGIGFYYRTNNGGT